jgi:hypothetical protein
MFPDLECFVSLVVEYQPTLSLLIVLTILERIINK